MPTRYAFLIPTVLCQFIHRIKGVAPNGVISVSSCKATKPKNVMNSGKVFEKMGEQWLGEPRIQKVISSERHRQSTKYLRHLCKTLLKGITPMAEDLRFDHADQGKDILEDLDSTMSSKVPATPIGNRPVVMASNSIARTPSRSAKNMFKSRRSLTPTTPVGSRRWGCGRAYWRPVSPRFLGGHSSAVSKSSRLAVLLMGGGYQPIVPGVE